MKTRIYYFTGTGNSLAVARQLAAEINNTSITPLLGCSGGDGMPIDADRVGFVFPLYFHGLPEIVLRFVRRMNPKGVEYFFAVITRGRSSGQAVHQLQEILARKGAKLSLAVKVTMPGNYIVEFDTAAPREAVDIVAEAKERVSRVARIVGNDECALEEDSADDIVEARKLYDPWLASVNEKDRAFFVEDTCTSCGICAGVCPVHNIVMENQRPKWKHRCQQCLACIHFCPEQAIQVPGSRRRGRYHYPGITAEDMILRGRGRSH